MPESTEPGGCFSLDGYRFPSVNMFRTGRSSDRQGVRQTIDGERCDARASCCSLGQPAGPQRLSPLHGRLRRLVYRGSERGGRRLRFPGRIAAVVRHSVRVCRIGAAHLEGGAMCHLLTGSRLSVLAEKIRRTNNIVR
jgi:hypothetical protein